MSLADAAHQLDADAVRILGASDVDPASPGWRTPTFAREVQTVRRQLRVLDDPGLLAIAFAHEAMHAARPGRVPAIWASPVRVAYAIRWIELETRIDLPAFRLWFT